MTKKASFRKNRMYLNRIENNYIKLYLQIFIAVSFLVRSNAVIRGHPRPGWSESGRPHSAVKQVINTVSDPVKRNHKLGPTSGSAPVEHRPAVNRHQVVSVEWYWFCVNPVCRLGVSICTYLCFSRKCYLKPRCVYKCGILKTSDLKY